MGLRRIRVIVAGVALLAASLASASSGAVALESPGTSLAAQRAAGPNVVFILTDDMRLDDMRYMDYTRKLFRRNGVQFTEAISPHPLCCPARAELVTGQYAQNNGVTSNKGGDWGGYAALRHREDLIFSWFQRAGYRTSYVGKFLNGFKRDVNRDIAGLTENNMAIEGVYRAYGMVTYNNGDPQRHRDHQTHYVSERVSRSITTATRRGKPFFAWAGYVAPHAMTPAPKNTPIPPRGYDTFDRGDQKAPSISQDNYDPDGDLGVSPAVVERVHRQRVLSLYAVDDGVRQIVKTLKSEGVYDDTILAFTSDNGFGMGAHGVMGKNQPYRDVVRVPLMLAGPGVPVGQRDSSLATLVDVPTTLAELAGVAIPLVQDGQSVFTLPEDRAVLIQAGSQARQWIWRGIYTGALTYVGRGSGIEEFYDRASDPQELHNLTDDRRLDDMRRLLERLGTCAGEQCRATYAGPG